MIEGCVVARYQKCELIRKNYLEDLEPLIADASIRIYQPIFVSRKVSNGLESKL